MIVAKKVGDLTQLLSRDKNIAMILKLESSAMLTLNVKVMWEVTITHQMQIIIGKWQQYQHAN